MEPNNSIGQIHEEARYPGDLQPITHSPVTLPSKAQAAVEEASRAIEKVTGKLPPTTSNIWEEGKKD